MGAAPVTHEDIARIAARLGNSLKLAACRVFWWSSHARNLRSPIMLLDQVLFPPGEPRAIHELDVGDGHRLWVEECGDPSGLPVLFLHGGPGSGCSPAQRRLFDPTRFRAVLVGQRGAGRSRPLGCLEGNTTDHLVSDLEHVRRSMGIPRWILFGGSWGSLLALRYAQAYPEHVLGMVLRGIFLGTPGEIDAYVCGARDSFPELWSPRGCGTVTPRELLVAYAAKILHGPEHDALVAARAWLDHERRLMGEMPLDQAPSPAQLAKVRIQMHYLLADCFSDRQALFSGIERIRHLPSAIVQGMADPVCPPQTALALHEAWPEADWIPVQGGGHSGMAADIAAACIQALSAVASACARAPNEGIPSAHDRPGG